MSPSRHAPAPGEPQAQAGAGGGCANSFLVSALGPVLPANLHLHLLQFEGGRMRRRGRRRMEKEDGSDTPTNRCEPCANHPTS